MEGKKEYGEGEEGRDVVCIQCKIYPRGSWGMRVRVFVGVSELWVWGRPYRCARVRGAHGSPSLTKPPQQNLPSGYFHTRVMAQPPGERWLFLFSCGSREAQATRKIFIRHKNV